MIKTRGPPLKEEQLIEEGLSLLFATETRHCHGNPGDRFVFRRSNGQELSICVPHIEQTYLMAHYIWQSSLALSHLMDLQFIPISDDTFVLELGAGAGLPSLLAYVNGARRVAVTDYPLPSLMENMRSNLERLEVDFSRMNVFGYAWGTEPPKELHSFLPKGSADLILMADIVWLSDSHADIIRSLKLFLHPQKGKAVMACCQHSPISEQKERCLNREPWFEFDTKNPTLLQSIQIHCERDLIDDPLLTVTSRSFLHLCLQSGEFKIGRYFTQSPNVLRLVPCLSNVALYEISLCQKEF